MTPNNKLKERLKRKKAIRDRTLCTAEAGARTHKI